MAKTMTLRLGDDQAAMLDVLARVDEAPVSETVRAAIEARIEARRQDPEFQKRLKRIMDEDRKILDALAQ